MSVKTGLLLGALVLIVFVIVMLFAIDNAREEPTVNQIIEGAKE